MFHHNVSRNALMNNPAQNKTGFFIPLIVPILRKADRTVVIGASSEGIALLIPACEVVMLGEQPSIAGIPSAR